MRRNIPRFKPAEPEPYTINEVLDDHMIVSPPVFEHDESSMDYDRKCARWLDANYKRCSLSGKLCILLELLTQV